MSLGSVSPRPEHAYGYAKNLGSRFAWTLAWYNLAGLHATTLLPDKEPAMSTPSQATTGPLLLDVDAVRQFFPALHQQVGGMAPVYLDNPGGTQVPTAVIEAMHHYLVESNSNSHGAFHTSRMTDQIIDQARAAAADLLNASPGEIVLGPNMTTLTFAISRSIGRTLSPGDEVVVTRMDHDANIAPWLLMARDHGLEVRWVDFDVETGRLSLDDLRSKVSPRTRLVACVYASNALGTINDVQQVIEMAHASGALTYIDAVQYAPHGPIDVAALGCDFLACSAYKFFGPHAGMVYGKHEHLASLPAYKVRPAADYPPDRWETGTLNHEGLAGVTAAVDYLGWVGEQYGAASEPQAHAYSGRRRLLKQGLLVIKRHEQQLSRRLLDGLQAIPGVKVYGITDNLDDRVPTVIFTIDGKHPGDVASALGQQAIYVWDGNYYALAVMERFGLEGKGGMVRVGAVHYNTLAEIDRFLEAVEHIARG
jgi:cysteine desulfurase family protein (TIGR01976 family)